MGGFLEDSAAFSRFYVAESRRLLVFFARRTFDAQAALDLTGETFAEAFACRSSFRGGSDGEAGGWVFVIARRQLARYFDAGAAERLMLARVGVEVPAAASGELERIDELAGLDVLRAAVRDQLEVLDRGQRDALRLRVVDERPYALVASELGISEHAARMRVFARPALARRSARGPAAGNGGDGAVSDQLLVLDELERRLLAGCYPPQPPAKARRRVWSWAALGGVLAAGGVAVAVLVGSGTVAPPPASALVDVAATIAQGPALPQLRPGEYWYTRTLISQSRPLPLTPKPGEAGGAPALIHVVARQSVETWLDLQGTLRTRTIPLQPQFRSAADHARWLAAGQPNPGANATDTTTAGDGRFPPQRDGGGLDPGDGLLSYSQLLALPTQPPALLQQLEAAQVALTKRETAAANQSLQHIPGAGSSATAQTLIPLQRAGPITSTQATAVGDLQSIAELLTTPIPTAVRAALFRTLATIPGVTYTSKARDPLGRTGVAVSAANGVLSARLVVDPRTGRLLANIQAPGTISTIVTQGAVDSINSLPAGAAPVPGPAGLTPHTLSISPRTGTTTTTFALTITNPTASSATSPPGTLLFQLSGPAGPNCQDSLPPLLQTPAAGHPASSGLALTTYDFTAKDVQRTTWRPGRYQIQVIADGLGTSAGAAGAVYFDVK